MKIDKSTPLPHTLSTDQAKVNAKAKGGFEATSQTGAATHVSQAATDTSRDIDPVRVSEIRQAISEGRLDIHVDKIADTLIESLKSMLEERQE